jgi:methyltransferase (TIGR00027 family)
MQPDRPSTTAERVALSRAAHQVRDLPPVFEDPLAVPMATAGSGAEGVARLREIADGTVARGLRAFVAARSRFAEEELAEAVRAGVGQYVVLGAGLDTFAYRNPYPGLRAFEVDHPATQAWKRERLARAAIPIPESLSFAPLDFEREALADALGRAGLRLGAPAFFSWLGVTPYLTPEAIGATFEFVARTVAPGSGIVFDYGVVPSWRSLRQRLAFQAVAARVAAAGEPWRTFFEPPVLASQLRAAGFTRVRDVGPAEINQRYFDGRVDGLRVGDVGHLVSAGT